MNSLRALLDSAASMMAVTVCGPTGSSARGPSGGQVGPSGGEMGPHEIWADGVPQKCCFFIGFNIFFEK